MDELNTLLDFASIPVIIGQQFRLFDLFYHTHSMVTSPDGYKFTVQYEGNRCVHDSQLVLNLNPCPRDCVALCLDGLRKFSNILSDSA